jgi:predicted RNA-binding protein with PUA-like domain
MNYWLLKSEPQVYSINDLAQEKQTIWDGVRNYQARNCLRQMQLGDLAFFYHSNVKNPGIVGLVKIVKTKAIDPTQFNPESKYYDPKSSPESPRWQTVIVEFSQAFTESITLTQLKQEFREDELLVVKKGNRLSVMPVTPEVAKKILART